MDTREKILTFDAARRLARPAAVAAGYFDVLRAEHVRELREFKERAAAPLVAFVLPLEDGFLDQRSRTELAAALRVVDYAVPVGAAELDCLVETLRPAAVLRLEAADARLRRRLIEHVRQR